MHAACRAVRPHESRLSMNFLCSSSFRRSVKKSTLSHNATCATERNEILFSKTDRGTSDATCLFWVDDSIFDLPGATAVPESPRPLPWFGDDGEKYGTSHGEHLTVGTGRGIYLGEEAFLRVRSHFMNPVARTRTCANRNRQNSTS